MGRKIKGRKHHGVRDPEAQREAREAKFIGKINSAPFNPDDQEIPRKLREISQYMSKQSNRPAARQPSKQPAPQPQKHPRKKKKLLDSGPLKIKEEGELGTKAPRNVPRFQQMHGESQYHFFQRVDRKVAEVLRRQSYEKKFNVEVSQDPNTGKNVIKPREKNEEELAKEEKRRKKIMKKKGIVIRTKEEKLELTRERRKLRKLKKKGKLPPLAEEEANDSDMEIKDNENRLKDFSQLQDKVAFNEVVHAPPSITLKNSKLNVNLQDPEARKPASKDGLLVKSMLASGKTSTNKTIKKKTAISTMSLAQKQIWERERTRVIEQYRALKKQRHQAK